MRHSAIDDRWILHSPLGDRYMTSPITARRLIDMQSVARVFTRLWYLPLGSLLICHPLLDDWYIGYCLTSKSEIHTRYIISYSVSVFSRSDKCEIYFDEYFILNRISWYQLKLFNISNGDFSNCIVHIDSLRPKTSSFLKQSWFWSVFES